MDRIPLTRFPDFEVRIPDVETQTRIVSVLSAYDDLIENNRRRIQLLSRRRERPTKSGSCDFRFPRA